MRLPSDFNKKQKKKTLNFLNWNFAVIHVPFEKKEKFKYSQVRIQISATKRARDLNYGTH